MSRAIRPPALRPGDRVAIVAPSSPFDTESFEAGLRVLRGRYEPVVPDGCFARTRYLAGDDGRRLDELLGALADDTVSAIVAARGGYGSMRLLPGLWPKLRAGAFRPKPVVGFSDITALHAALQSAGWASVHGPVLTQLGSQPGPVVERLVGLLESTTAPPAPLHGTSMIGGVAEGPLLGGNMSTLTRLLGTPYLPALDGAILLLEDRNERPYRLDRMWTHLALAGVFERIRGLALGQFVECEEAGGDYGSAEVLAELAAGVGLPCVAGLPIGHVAVNQPVPLGCRVRVDGTAGRLEFLEPSVAAP